MFCIFQIITFVFVKQKYQVRFFYGKLSFVHFALQNISKNLESKLKQKNKKFASQKVLDVWLRHHAYTVKKEELIYFF